MFVLRTIVGTACAALALFSVLACSATGDKAAKKGAPVARVNGTAITKPELDRAVKLILAKKGVTQAPSPRQMQQAADQALIQLTTAELLYQAASKLDAKEIELEAAGKYAQSKARFKTDAEHAQSLARMDLTAEESQELIRKETFVNKLVEREIAAKVAVGEAQCRAFYRENLERLFKKGERLRASHILVGVEQKAPAKERQKAREKAQALLKRVQAGDDFAVVARNESTCPSSARGGELGIFGKGEISPLFERAAYALDKGELSPVVETERGYHIIRLHEKVPPRTERFDEVREKIALYLKGEMTRQAVAAFVEELRKNAKIEKV